jgi:hypothetical protein
MALLPTTTAPRTNNLPANIAHRRSEIRSIMCSKVVGNGVHDRVPSENVLA